MLASERGKVTAGSINYDGNTIDKQNPSQMVNLGMVQVLEGRRCFGQNIFFPPIPEPFPNLPFVMDFACQLYFRRN